MRFECVDLLSYSTGESYNLILDNGCLHHQHPGEIGAYLQKVVRLLDRHRPSYFALSTYKNPTLAERVDQNGRLHKYFTDKEIHEHLRLTHLEVFHEHEVFRPFKGDHYRFSICRIRQNEIASD